MIINQGIRPKLHSNNSLFVDIRSEIDILFNGGEGVNGFSSIIILRHFDKKQKSSGYDELKGESLKDQTLSAGYSQFVSTDTFVRAIKKKILGRMLDDQSGLSKENIGIFYLPHNTVVVDNDYIIQMLTDDNGNAIYPIKYLKKYRIKDVEKVIGNNGRVEYLNVYSEWIE